MVYVIYIYSVVISYYKSIICHHNLEHLYHKLQNCSSVNLLSLFRYVGLSMLIFGFLVLFGSMIYCVFVCREVEKLRPPPGELYWNNHWSKTVHVPEIHYSNNQNRPADYRGSEFSYKTDRTEPSRLTAGNDTYNSMPRY